jgi:hypothetical protein
MIRFQLMRVSFLSVLLAVSSMVFTGCESGGDAMPARMRERFQPPQPKVQVFEAERPAVFAAAIDAMRQLDFQVSRSRMAQGIINAHSRLQAAGSFGKARQYTMEVRLHSYEPGKTDVSVILREQEESASFAGATDLVLREHALYGSFFAALERSLGVRGTPAAEAAKP